MSTYVRALSPAVRLCAFGILVLLMFLAAGYVGRQLGPVGPDRARSTVLRPSGGGGMNMGAGTVPADRIRGGTALTWR
jgi:hypothetical protein